MKSLETVSAAGTHLLDLFVIDANGNPVQAEMTLQMDPETRRITGVVSPSRRSATDWLIPGGDIYEAASPKEKGRMEAEHRRIFTQKPAGDDDELVSVYLPFDL